MANIPSPYYFVPRNDHVILLDEAEARSISQDHPFKDGLCGSFDIALTATTPIFIRDSQSPETSFRLPNGLYAVPPSTLAGATRHILGAVSFGKLKRIADRTFSVRDLHSEKYKQLLGGIETGWLQMVDGKPQVFPCDCIPIQQQDLEEEVEQLDLGSRQTAAEKYAQWEDLVGHNFDYTLHLEGEPYRGTLVFAGQAADRWGNKPGNPVKTTERLFLEPQCLGLQVPKRVMAEFETLHDDPMGLWQTRWKAVLLSGDKVPVFFCADSSTSVGCMGLSEMMRLPSPHSLHDRLGPAKDIHLGDGIDLPDAIFGRTAEEDGGGLRRRVDFSALVTNETTIGQLTSHKTLMGEPKPSYYPNYLEQQPGSKHLVTYLDDADTARIRGRKFYAAREDSPKHSLPPAPAKAKGRQTTTLTPLPAGLTFRGIGHIHNLRPFELGALIWSLTLGEHPATAPSRRLLLGGGRPHGLGNVKVRLSNPTLRSNDGRAVDPQRILQQSLEAFESWMDARLPSWKASPQLRELLAIHTANHGVHPKKQLGYPEPWPKAFRDHAGKKDSLPDFSRLTRQPKSS